MICTASPRAMLCATVLAALLIPAASAQTVPAPEPSVPLTDSTDSDQYHPVGVSSAEGGTLALWVDSSSVSSGFGVPRVLARRFLPSGRPTGAIIEVEPESYGATELRVSQAEDGSWVAVWSMQSADNTGAGIFARLFDAQDQAMTPRIRVNAPTGDFATYPASVAIEPQGGAFVVVWEDSGTSSRRGRRFVLDVPQGDEFQVGAGHGAPEVSMGTDGSFVVVWSAWVNAGDNPGYEVLSQMFSASGQPIGDQMQLSWSGGPAERGPRLGRDAAGNRVVAWEVDGGALRFRRMNSDGEPIGGIFEVARSGPAERQSGVHVAVDARGGIAIGWRSENSVSGEHSVHVQRFTSEGAAMERRALSGGTITPYDLNGLTSDADGDVSAFWTGADPWSGRTRAFFQRLPGSNAPDLQVSIDDGQFSVGYGSPHSYQIKVKHLGEPGGLPGEGAAVGFHVEITLSEYSTFDRIDAMNWTCSGGGPIYCQYDLALAPGDTAEPIVVHALAPQLWTGMTANVQLHPYLHPDPQSDNDRALDQTMVGDISPDAFSVADRSDVERSTLQVSDAVSVRGFNVPVVIAVWDGEYSINNGPFTSEDGLVEAYDLVRVRHASSSAWSGSVTSRLFVGDVSDWFTSTTLAQDIAPDAFTLVDRTDVPLGLPVTSTPIVVTGINDSVTVSIVGGSYSVNGGAFTTQAGSVQAGDNLRVQHTASLQHATRTDSELSVGGISDTFSSTTVARDVAPDPFSFMAQTDVARGSERTSDEVTILGINDVAEISVAGGSYSIDGGAFTNTAGTILSGQRLRLRHVAAAGFATNTTTTIMVGTSGASFISTTESQDAVPSAFAFVDRSSLATAVEVVSDPITVVGINVATPVSVAGGSYGINGGAFTTTAGSVVAGDQVRVRHVSSSSANAPVTTTLTIGGVSDGFTSTTGANDSTPNAFAFTDVIGAKRNKAVTSAPVTVSGINVAVPISVSGGGARWSKNGGAYTTSTGSVMSGDQVRLQVTMPNTSNTMLGVQVNIGGVTDLWNVTTGN